MGRRILQLILAVMLSAVPLVLSAGPARADDAGTLLGLVNSLRAAHGVGPLSVDPTLTANAQAWSAHMASANALSHNPNVGSGLAGGWTKLGENVGEGGNIQAIFGAFVNSSFHLENMLDPTYNLTGIAVAVGRPSTLWVTEDFEAKPGAAPVTTRPPTPATTATTAAARPLAPSTTTTRPAPAPAPVATVAPATTSSTVAASGTPATAPVTIAPPAAGTSLSGPGKLAAAASLPAPGATGGSPGGWVVVLSAVALVSLASAAFMLRWRAPWRRPGS